MNSNSRLPDRRLPGRTWRRARGEKLGDWVCSVACSNRGRGDRVPEDDGREHKVGFTAAAAAAGTAGRGKERGGHVSLMAEGRVCIKTEAGNAESSRVGKWISGTRRF